MEKAVIDKFLCIAQSALNGVELSEAVSELLKKHSYQFKSNPLLESAWIELSHFISDSDIRDNDKDYDLLLRKRLKEYIIKIKASPRS